MFLLIAVHMITLQTGSAQQELVDALWHADAADRQAAATALSNGVPSFTELLALLQAGPTYRADEATGRREFVHVVDDVPHRFFIVVPDSYTPSRQYPVRLFLHGGVARRAAPDSGGSWWTRWDGLANEDYIAVFPASWSMSPWWTPLQVQNLTGVVNILKRHYNVDENRVVVFGVSDGGTGLYYLALKNPTPFASFLPLIGHPAVLNNPRLRAPGELFIRNLSNRPFFIANAYDDRQYPARSMQGFLSDFRAAGVDLEFHPQPGGHGVSWWAAAADTMEAFIRTRPRTPHPERILWETEVDGPFRRLHWIVIDSVDVDAPVYEPQGDPFPHDTPSGYVSAAYRGNEIRLATEHVLGVTILLSPTVFDFDRPIVVQINGREAFNGRVSRSSRTLAKWAAIDLDRTMLFGAELSLSVPP